LRKSGSYTPRLPISSPKLSSTQKSHSLPKSVDWRERGAVNPIQNQKDCGSCWAFSAVCAMEGRYAVKSGNLLKFSESQVVDCDSNDNGCKGGLPWNVYPYYQMHGVIERKNYK